MELVSKQNTVEVIPTSGFENAPEEVKGTLSDIKKYISGGDEAFGDSFSVEDYWVKATPYDIDSLNEHESIRTDIARIFDELIKFGKLKQNKDGTYAFLVLQPEENSIPILQKAPAESEEKTSEPEPEPELEEVGGFKVGEEVQWVSNEVAQFEKPQLIERFNKTPDGKTYVFFKDSTTGIPILQLEHISPSQLEQEQPSENVEGETTPEWKESEEWKKFEEMRDGLARYEMPRKGLDLVTVGLELKKEEYFNYKNTVAKKIREVLTKEAGDNLTPEQQAELENKIHNTEWEELLEKEDYSYKKALEEHRSETLMNKIEKTRKSAINTKLGQWYKNLGWKKRILLSSALITLGASAFGTVAATGALTFGAKRVGRGVLAFGASTVGRGTTEKILSEEKIKEKWKKELEELKTSEASLENKSRKIQEINERYEKKLKNVKLTKTGVAVLAGAGTAAFVGLVGNEITDNNIEALKAPEALEQLKEVVSEPEIAKASVLETSEVEEAKEAGVKTKPDSDAGSDPELETENELETGEVSKEIFSDPSVVQHDPVIGDSTWKMLNDTLENNERFHGLSGTAEEIEAKKTFVVSSLTNELLKNADQYDNIGPNGEVSVGNTVNFAGLFTDGDKFNEILNKAENLKPTQVSSIVEHNNQIAEWVKANPNAKLTNDEVVKILNIKPEDSPELVVSETPIKVEPIKSPIPDTLETKEIIAEVSQEPKPYLKDEAGAEHELPYKQEPEASETQLPVENNPVEKQIHEDIAEAKAKLEVLEGGKNINNGLRTMAGDIYGENGIEEAVANGVDNVYGKKGFLGIGKVSGINTEKWGEISGLPANKVVEYYMGNSNESGLDSDIVKMLSESKKHGALMDQIAGLMKQAGEAFKPFENENVEGFLRRLVKYSLEHSQTQLPKAA